MDFGKCFRSVTHEGKVPGSIRRVAFRTPFIDALCVSFQAERREKKRKKRKRKRRQQTQTHHDETCPEEFFHATRVLTFSFAFVFLFPDSGEVSFFFCIGCFSVDDSQRILFNTIKYYEREKDENRRCFFREGNKNGIRVKKN